MLIEFGTSIIKDLKPFGKVFADPKLHDIPNTIANSIERFSKAGADLITMHASNGAEAIKAAVKNRGNASILCVTALTSLTDTDTNYIYNTNSKDTVIKLAELANDNGAQGIVCSPLELEYLNDFSFLKVTPGIRPSKVNDDQKRVATPKQAVDSGSSLLVIGRPITQANNSLEVVKSINKEI